MVNKMNGLVARSMKSLRWLISILAVLGIAIFLSIILPNIISLRYTLTIFFVSVGIYILIISYLVYRDLFTPSGIMGPIWFITIGIANLQLSTYQHEWDLTTWLVLLGSTITFLLGCFTGAMLSPNINTRHLSINLPEFANRYEARKISNAIWLLFVMSFIAYWVQVYKLGYIPILGQDLIQAYLEFPEPIWFYLMVPSMLVCILIYLYLKVYKPSKKITYYIIFLLSLGMLITTLSRVFFLFVMVGMLIVKNYFSIKPIKIKYLLVVLLIGMIFFIYIGNIRTIASGRNLIEFADLRISPPYTFLAWPYYSLSLNIENLRILVNNLAHYYYGAKTFFPILFFIRVYKSIDYPNLIIPERISTTSTYLADFYTDFGLIGTLLIPYILGIISTGIYYRLRRKPTLNLLFFNIIVVYSLLFSFLLNFFARQWIFVLLVLTPILDLYCRKNGNPALPIRNIDTVEESQLE